MEKMGISSHNKNSHIQNVFKYLKIKMYVNFSKSNLQPVFKLFIFYSVPRK